MKEEWIVSILCSTHILLWHESVDKRYIKNDG